MTSTTALVGFTRRGPWRALLALAASALLLGGCAAPQAPASGADALVTPSEETETRRRARIRLELAIGYYEQGKTEIALDEVRQAIATDPTLPDAYTVRGLIYMRLGDQRLAEESFRRAVALNPRESNALHNLGWLQCQASRFDESFRSFEQAMLSPMYTDKAKTLMTLGVCQARAGRVGEAEQSLARAYELDAGNPITGYNLANLLFRRGEFQRSQFYIRRLNNSELANAESLWLGVKVERRMNDPVAMQQLGEQLRKRFPQSKERGSYDRGAYDE